MKPVLEICRRLPERRFEAGKPILTEDEKTGVLYVLIEGSVEILKGQFQIGTVAEPGAVFGEISLLLDCPHMATVKTLAPSRFYVISKAKDFLRKNPDMSLHVAALLAQRLRSVTGHMMEMKEQFKEAGNHLVMIHKVLDSLLSMQLPDDFV